MKTARELDNQSGFTLIEALVAIAIFSIGLMAVGALQARSLMSTGDVARRTEAWALLDEQVSQLKAMPFYQDAATQTFTPDLDENGGGFAHQVDRQMNGTYTVHWQVVDDTPIGQVDTTATVLAGLPAGNYTVCKQITIVVTPQGGDPATDEIAQAQFIKTWAATDL